MSEEMKNPVEEQTADPVETQVDSGTTEQTEQVEAEEQDTGQEAVEQEDRKPSRGVQKRIDELVREREEARRREEYWRDAATRNQQPNPQEQQVQPVSYPDLPKPKSDDFETYDEYVEALADWKSETKFRQIKEQEQVQAKQGKLKGFYETGVAKYPDWQTVFTTDLPVSNEMAEVLLSADNGVDIAYYLGQHPEEARRIKALPSNMQPYEMGKLEARLSATPPQKSKTSAPAPTAPVGGKSTPQIKPEDMEYEDYKRWRAAGGGV